MCVCVRCRSAAGRVVVVAVFDCVCAVTAGKSVVNLLGIRVQSASLHAFGDSLGNRAATHGEVTASSIISSRLLCSSWTRQNT